MILRISFFFKIFVAIMGFLIFLVGLIHLCCNSFGTFKIDGVKTQGQFVVSFIAIFLLFTGLATIVGPFIGFIPFPIVKRFGNMFNPKVLIPWFLIHGLICLFMTGFLGFFIALLCFLTVIIAIVAIFFAIYDDGDDSD